jgi:citronellol/citronellal dehydrogenase
MSDDAPEVGPSQIDRPDLSDSAAFITGTTRGIGKQLALALASCGCDVVSTGKTVDDSDSDLEGTIHKTAEACAEFGVDTHAIQLDVRDEDAVAAAVEEAIDELGEINVVINNASAIQMASVADLPGKRYDLMNEVNVRGTYLVAREFIDHLTGLEKDAWILANAPPVRMDRAPGKAAYAWSKMGMSFVTLSLAQELGGYDVGCNSFWPVTAIDTRATRYFGLGDEDDWRTPSIVADAVLEILKRDPAEFTGEAVYDEDVLRAAGVEDFGPYNLTPGDPEPTSARLFDPDYERAE